MPDLFFETFGFTDGMASRSELKSACEPTRGCRDGARNASARHRATTNCESGPGGMSRARGSGRRDSLEQGQAPADHGDDGLSGPLGAAAELAGDGGSLRGQLGGGLSLGRMVRGLGLGAPRVEGGVESIGVDEIHWGHGLRASNFLTVIYQIDARCRRLLWVGPGRSQRTLHQG